MDTIITNAAGYSSVEYSRLLEQAQAKGVSAAKVDETLINAIQAGKDFTAAVKDVRSQLPDLASPGDNSGDLSGWVALPSPAAMFASVILKDAAEQRRTNRSIIQAQGLQIVDLMEQQADKIETGAIQKFACAVTGALVNMAAGGASLGVAAAGVGRSSSGGLNMRAGNAADGQLTAAVAQSFSTMISAAGSMFTAGGEFGQSLRSAEAKRLEAQQEQIRTMMEQTKQTNEALKDLVSKSLDFMNSMQANMNQTRTKILG